MGESIRQLKVASQIKQDLSEIFAKNLWKKLGNIMVTITHVKVTKDLSVATVLISVFPVEDKVEVYHIIHKSSHEIRYHLGKKMRKKVKMIPELHFKLDDSLDYIDNIERLLNKE